MMAGNPSNMTSDLRAAAGLTIDAVVGVTNIVEALHHTIAGGQTVPHTDVPARMKGIPGLVYRNVRGVTKMVGGGIDLLLSQMGTALGEQESPPAREAIVAALNGVIGDYLVAHHNPLAIAMELRRDGQPLDDGALVDAVQSSNRSVLIMVHGLCMNDRQWSRHGHDHGAALARDLGITPLYVYYNSGRHTSENGWQLAGLLEKMAILVPGPLEIVMVGFSMGGLVARSACYYGEVYGHRWRRQLNKLIFLATPHHGAVLEKGGNVVDIVLGSSPYSAPFSRLGKIRSSGLTDLRYGHVLESDWQGRNRFHSPGDWRTPLPLPTHVDCYAIAAARTLKSGKLEDELMGDGLVPLNSALGIHDDPALDLSFPESRKWTGRPMNHLDLLDQPQVYETIKNWVGN